MRHPQIIHNIAVLQNHPEFDDATPPAFKVKTARALAPLCLTNTVLARSMTLHAHTQSRVHEGPEFEHILP